MLVHQLGHVLVTRRDNNASGDDALLWLNKPNNNDWGIIQTGDDDYGIDLRMASSHSYAIRVLRGGSEAFRVNSDYAYHYSDMRSPIFYDSSSTGYYLDPAGASNLNTSVRANEFYARNWFRNDNSGEGLYNQSTGMHWYSDSSSRFRLYSGSSSTSQILMTTSGNSARGYVYATNSNEIGFLDAGGSWAIRHANDNGTYFYTDNSTLEFRVGRDTVTGNYGTVQTSSTRGGWGGYSINGHWVFMHDHSNAAGIYNDIENEWAIYMLRNSYVELMYNGTWELATRSGYGLARGSMRAPLFYDSNDTAFYSDPNATSRIRGLTTLNVITSPGITGNSGSLRTKDNRIIAPNEDTAGEMKFGFSSWNNDNAAPYADYLHLRSYTDASGGSDNLLMFKKSGRGMRLWQQTFNSGTAYSAYSDVAIYNANPGNTPFYASRYYDSNNTAYYGDFASTSIVNIIRYASGGYAEFQTAAGNIRGYMQATDDNDAHLKIATSGGEDIRFTDGGLSGDWNVIIRGDGQTLIRSRLDTPIMYDRDDTGYYSNPAGASNFNTSIRANEVYARNWFRNDNSGEGMYNQATGMHWYSTNNTTWRAYGGQTTVKIEMNTASNTLRGSFYANNSDEVGILSQDNGWALQATNSKVDAHHNFYAPIFYDRDDSNYYVNPAGDARISGTVQANRFTHRDAVSQNDTFGLYFADNASTAYAIYRESGGWSSPYPDLRIAFHTGIKFGANSGYQGMRFYNDYNMVTQVMSINNGSDPLGANDVYVNNSLQSGNSLRSPIFYDSNDTARYTNPASTSEMGTIRADRFDMRDRGDWITFYGDDSTNHGIASRGSTGTATDDIRINTYGSLFINLDSNNNNTSGADFYIGRHGSATGTIANSDLFRVYGDDNYAYSAYSFRAPIFYDSNDTGYYCNPNSSSNFATSVRANEFYARNWFRNDNGAEGLYNQNNGCHFYARSSQYWHATGNNNASAINMQLRSTYDGNIRMWLHGDSSSWCGYLNDGGQWMIRTRMTDGSSPNHWYYEDSNTTWTGNPGNDKGKIEYHSDRFYIAAGGNSNRICQFRRDGTDKAYVNNDGVYVGTATSAQWADLAERYSADEVYENGTLLGMNLDGESEGTLYQPGMPILGVISTSPGVKMNDMEIEDDNSLEGKMNPYIALKGRIPCLVSQPVKKGQWVIPDVDGKAKGVDYGTSGINSYEIIGIALSDSENGEVEVKV